MSELTNYLLESVASAKTRNEMAKAYRIALTATDVDWKAVNTAIEARWSRSGLIHIKEQAWKFAKAS